MKSIKAIPKRSNYTDTVNTVHEYGCLPDTLQEENNSKTDQLSS